MKTLRKTGFGGLPGFYRRRRRRRWLTAVRCDSWGFSSPFSWCRALSLSFSLGYRPLPLSFLSFPFLFLFGFSLGFFFSFLFFSFFPFFFSLGGFLVKSSNDLVFGWLQPLMDANNAWISQQRWLHPYLILSLMNKGRKRRFRAVKCRFHIYSKRCLMFSILVLINCTDKLSWTILAPLTHSIFFSVCVPGYFVFLSGTVKSL